MKLKMVKLLPVLAVAATLSLAGCSSAPGMGDDGAGVTDASVNGAAEGGAWNGSPTDDPNSLLSTKIIYFGYDISEIPADYQDIVVAHGAYLASNPQVRVSVEGHADERGSREYNIALGEDRAKAVKRMLLAQGASESQISTVSYGEERPSDISSNEAAWSANRRVELRY
jgi:peptidoglycan-associated lipoprotein